MMKVMENREQSTVLNYNKVDELYDNQVAYLQTLKIDRSIKLYLNIANMNRLKT